MGAHSVGSETSSRVQDIGTQGGDTPHKKTQPHRSKGLKSGWVTIKDSRARISRDKRNVSQYISKRTMLLKVFLACLICSSNAFSPRSREAKNSKLLNWSGSQAEESSSPLDLASAEEMETDQLMKSIAALNAAEMARENFRLLDRMLGQKSRRGKEGQDLLDPLELRLLEGADDQMDLERQGSVRQVDNVEVGDEELGSGEEETNSIEGAGEEE